MVLKYLSFLILFVSLFLLSCNSVQDQAGINPLPNFDAMWDYQHPDSTETYFKKILSTLNDNSESSYNAEYHVELLTQIARAQGLQGKHIEAENTLISVKNLLSDNMQTAKIRYLLEKGRLLNSSGKPKKAKSFFLEAFEFGKVNALDFHTLDAAHMMGIVEPADKQIGWNMKALKIAEDSEDQRCKNWLGSLYNNIGWSHHNLEKFEEALGYFQKGLDWRLSVNDERGARIAQWTIGRTFRDLKRYDEALEIQLKLKNEIEEKQLSADGYVFEELAELYLMKNEKKEAKKYFRLAYEILSQDNWMQKNEQKRLNRIKNLGKKYD